SVVRICVADRANHAGSGTVSQKGAARHGAVRAICGDRLATVRLVTLMRESGPQLFRACWKIPAGKNAADNFWRAGNLLAELDLESGTVLRVFRGTGIQQDEVTHHPDTNAPIVGTTVPNWTELRRLALEGAKVVKDIALIGWDVAPVDDGGLVVELNDSPDFILPQIANRRGLLDGDFLAFMAERKKAEAAWVQE